MFIKFPRVFHCKLRRSPSHSQWCYAEFVGWTILDGRMLVIPDPNVPTQLTVEDTDGVTIFNSKVGVRVFRGRTDFYVGYGRALTGSTWYKDILRVEYRFAF